MIGETIAHYRILEQLGAGGGGEVYLAEDLNLDRRVALKLLPPRLATDPESLERFRREARALAALNHPNITTIYSVEECDGHTFLTMEFVSGRTVAQLIPNGGMPFREFLDIVLPLVKALCLAHENGIVHRDLKPANVMVSDDGLVKVLDFGLAKLRRDDAGDPGEAPLMTITRPGMLMGTLQYMSPEQIEGRPADQRSDIFALGAMFFEMLSGSRPFLGDSGPTIVSSIFRDIPPRVSDFRPTLPQEISAIVDRCLEKTPDSRYQTSRDLLDDLLALPSSDPELAPVAEARSETRPTTQPTLRSIRATPPAPADLRPARTRYRPRTALLALLGVMIVAAAVWIPLRFVGGERPRSKIVILPFENLGDAEDSYFAAGMTEEIASRLATVPKLGVISRISSLQYDPKGKSVKQIGRDLGVDYLLEGSIRWDRGADGTNRVRVTPRLVRVADDTQLWSERYERDVVAIFEVQAEIAGAVVERLDMTLQEPQRQAIEKAPTKNLDAHLAYLRGMAHGRGASEEDARLSVEMLETAVRLDPEFVDAWYRLSKALSYLHSFDYDQAHLAGSLEAAQKALQLAPERPEGHMALANYYFNGLRDAERGLEEYQIVLRMRPDDGTARFNIGFINAMKGNWESGIAMMEGALELDPRNGDLLQVLADGYQRLRRFEDAERALDAAKAIVPDDLLPYWRKVDLYWCWDGTPARARAVLEVMPKTPAMESTRLWWMQEFYERNWQAALDRIEAAPWDWYRHAPRAYYRYCCWLRLGNPRKARSACEEALAALEERVKEIPDDAELRGRLGIVYAILGRREDALRQSLRISELSPLSGDAFYAPEAMLDQARIDVFLDEPDRAIDRIETLLRIPSCLTPAMLRLDPDWDRLRENPRFRALLERTPGGGPDA